MCFSFINVFTKKQTRNLKIKQIEVIHINELSEDQSQSEWDISQCYPAH